jgi:hypothetical protein
MVRCPAVVNDLDTPEAVVRVAPPSEDDRAVKCYFTSGGVKEHFAPSIAQDGNKN